MTETSEHDRGRNVNYDGSQAFEAALTEYKCLGEDIQRFIGYTRRDTQIIILAVSTVIAVSSSALAAGGPLGFHFAALVIPTLCIVYLLTQIANMHVIHVQAYRRFQIERDIHDLVGRDVMRFHTETGPKHLLRWNSPNGLAYLVNFLIVFCVFAFFAGYSAYWDSPFTLIIHIPEALALAGVFWAFIYAKTQFNR